MQHNSQLSRWQETNFVRKYVIHPKCQKCPPPTKRTDISYIFFNVLCSSVRTCSKAIKSKFRRFALKLNISSETDWRTKPCKVDFKSFFFLFFHCLCHIFQAFYKILIQMFFLTIRGDATLFLQVPDSSWGNKHPTCLLLSVIRHNWPVDLSSCCLALENEFCKLGYCTEKTKQSQQYWRNAMKT